ncbi:hypothetical protein M9Y10_017955 [Tritrichomonas musculus]|uniref:Uncharacterized protein n=1 Tax=Tritrichomonas musculus TaxID=1915356 RepID=A0ABR2HV76_9EUKA
MVINDGNTPLPIETTYFLEDAQHDKAQFNRDWFNFPPEWSTSNKGESIVGVRSAQIIKRRRKLEVEMAIRNFTKDAFIKHGGKVENEILTDEQLKKFQEDDTKEIYKKDTT